MKDQKNLWNQLHSKGNILKHSGSATSFAQEVAKTISPNSKILEFGCGVGNDSIYFASIKHTVIATDFSDLVIKENTEKYKDIQNLTFKVLDMSQVPYSFSNDEFNVIYARLAIHYFTDAITRKIIDEVHRILKPNGYFSFMCKSVNDPLYGKGDNIEGDMYENEGHVRHFFSKDYSKKLLKDTFEIVKIETGEEDLYGKKSGFVKVIATKF